MKNYSIIYLIFYLVDFIKKIQKEFNPILFSILNCMSYDEINK